MFYLIATILLNVVISAMFKVFPRFKIDAMQAIVTNYWVCVLTGCLFIGHFPVSAGLVQQTWFPWALLMGSAFICIFNLIAYCTRIDGITTTIIANKLSLVIPVLFSVILWHESLSVFKLIGIILAFPAIYFITRVSGEGGKPQSLFWPAMLFLGSGLLDTLVNFVQANYLASADVQATYTIFCFLTAATIGSVAVIVLIISGKIALHWRNIIAGVCVGIPNYFSIYFLIRSLNSHTMSSSATIPVINIGILLASSLMAIFLFREKANGLRILGLILSVIAILLIAKGDL